MGGSLDLIGGALGEQQRVLERLLHRLEVADPFAKIGDIRFQRGAMLRFIFERLDELVEKLVDVGGIVALQLALERLVLDVDYGDLVHMQCLHQRFIMKSSIESPPSDSRIPAELTVIPGGTTR